MRETAERNNMKDRMPLSIIFTWDKQDDKSIVPILGYFKKEE